ncbi:hypothetical protein [Deinococcus sp. QL22]|nr:hypothetical protein [Deinococcus sp. QL22]
MSPTRILPQTRNVTVSEADSIIARHAKRRNMNPASAGRPWVKTV